jgi:hypothetical protein
MIRMLILGYVMYEFAVMVSITLSGCCGLPWWTVIPATALLSLPTLLQLAVPAATKLHNAGRRGRLALSCSYWLLAAACFAGGE